MAIKVGRVVITAVVVEALAIISLVGIVALLGPSDPELAPAYAQKVGYWFGPVAGFGLCLAGGWFVARYLTHHQIRNGFALGATVAAIDIALILVMGASFQVIFVASNVGRLLAGTIGGWLASLGGSSTA